MNTERRQKLIETISRAFADVPYPGDDHIFTPDSYDDEEITAYFSGTTWRGHSAEELRAHCSSISVFFTPEAYRYWLPAYLIAAVEDPDELSQGVDSLLSSLARDCLCMEAKYQQLTRLGLLTPEQLSAVIDVVEYLERLFYDPAHPQFTERESSVVAYLREVSQRAGA